jgi:hypothetical protein
MKPFIVAIEAEIEAEDIDDARRRLGEYFLAMSRGEDYPSIFVQGNAVIAPITKFEAVASASGEAKVS